MTAALFAAASMGAESPSGFATVNSPVVGVIAGSGPVTTDPAHVTTTGGTSPYTYAWSIQLGGDEWTINSPTSSSTTFTYDSLNHSDRVEGIAKVIVTDDNDLTTTLYVSIQARSTSTV